MAGNWLTRILRRDAAPIVRPALPPSTIRTDSASDAEVEARADMFSNAVTGLGRRNSKTSCNRWDFQWGRDSWTLENFFTFNPLASRIITLEPKLALKKGFAVSGLDEEDQKSLDDFNRRRSFLSKYGQARVWDRQFGGAIIFMDVQDGQESDQPVDINRIETVGQLTPFDRWDLTITDLVPNLATGETFTPEFYTIAQTGQNIHPSRVIEFRGIPTTSREIVRNQGWGASELDRIFKVIERYDTTRSYMAEAITRLTQGVLTSPELGKAGKSQKSEGAKGRLTRLMQDMGLLGDMVLQEGETYEVKQRGLQGFGEASAVSRSDVVAATGIPDSILFGESAGGMNSGENKGDWQTVAADVSGAQTHQYSPKISKYLEYVFASRQSPIKSLPDRWNIKWPEILEIPESEHAQIDASYGNMAATLVQVGIIRADEARGNEHIADAFPLEDLDPEDEEFANTLRTGQGSGAPTSFEFAAE